VEILPWGDDNTSKTFLAETDIFVMTSVFEGLPFSLLEAMAVGIPCVVSKVDGNTDVIHNMENGMSCLTEHEFCSKLEMLINNISLRKTLGSVGAAYVNHHHNLTNMALKLAEFYKGFSY